MGLDNGFIVQGIKKGNIPYFVRPIDIYSNGEIEIAYYRKCWGIRNAILRVLYVPLSGGGNYEVEAEDILAILQELYKFLDREYWEDNADSIWTFEEAIDYTLIQQIINLKWLYSYMIEHPKVKCYFYDSF